MAVNSKQNHQGQCNMQAEARQKLVGYTKGLVG